MTLRYHILTDVDGEKYVAFYEDYFEVDGIQYRNPRLHVTDSGGQWNARAMISLKLDDGQ